ncbi:hypothetical protein ACFE04_011577 [Oxalis oulophora]
MAQPFELDQPTDAGAGFVLESKGKWWHAGFHLTTAIVGPSILTLPYIFRGLGWVWGCICLTAMGFVAFYSYYLMSKVLDHCESVGRRHKRYRELAVDVLGSGWVFYLIIFTQTTINSGVCIGAILLAGESMESMYSNLYSNGSLKLYHFIALVTVVLIFLSQLPSFHSLRHINFASLILCLTYSFLTVAACIITGLSENAPERDYSLESSESGRVFNAFTSVSIIASIYGNGILPEIQATLAPPASGKMFKALLMCYAVILITFYATVVSGYYVFGNKSTSNILQNLLPDHGNALAPIPLLALAVFLVLLQLLAIGLVYSQVAYDIIEKQAADVKQGIFSKRNLIPRLILRTIYVIFCGTIAAMLPFFGDINGVIGAFGFIPLDFILPMILYNVTHKPLKSSITYWINTSIIVIFTGVVILGAFSSVRNLLLDANQFKLFSSEGV